MADARDITDHPVGASDGATAIGDEVRVTSTVFCTPKRNGRTRSPGKTRP
ncbi:hypothetical protein N9L76_04110 [bacterium]|nr:hypothetical protein [bacterium]